MKTGAWTMAAWVAAALAVGLALSSARDARATLDGLPVVAWRGVPLNAALLSDPEESADAAAEAAAPPEEVDGAFLLEMDRFAFDDYDAPELRGDDTPLEASGYPGAIARFDGADVQLEGFVQPLEFEEGKVTVLRLTRFPPGCCFGALPQYDEWVEVQLAGEGDTFYDAYAQTVFRGQLEVGERLDDDGLVEALYRLVEGRRVE